MDSGNGQMEITGKTMMNLAKIWRQIQSIVQHFTFYLILSLFCSCGHFFSLWILNKYTIVTLYCKSGLWRIFLHLILLECGHCLTYKVKRRLYFCQRLKPYLDFWTVTVDKNWWLTLLWCLFSHSVLVPILHSKNQSRSYK